MSPTADAQIETLFQEYAVGEEDDEDGEEEGASVGASLVEVAVIDTHCEPEAEGGFSFPSPTPVVPLVS